ncbi:MAG: chlorophyllide reductase iron protein subunit X, partial [Alphaproteobacteria bacterium]
RMSGNYEMVGKAVSPWASVFERVATIVAEAPALHPTPLSQDGLLDLFNGEDVGRNVQLEPATVEDMCGVSHVEKPSLEVIYDTV